MLRRSRASQKSSCSLGSSPAPRLPRRARRPEPTATENAATQKAEPELLAQLLDPGARLSGGAVQRGHLDGLVALGRHSRGGYRRRLDVARDVGDRRGRRDERARGRRRAGRARRDRGHGGPACRGLALRDDQADLRAGGLEPAHGALDDLALGDGLRDLVGDPADLEAAGLERLHGRRHLQHRELRDDLQHLRLRARVPGLVDSSDLEAALVGQLERAHAQPCERRRRRS